MKASRKLVSEVASKVERHPATVWRWVARGCNIESEASIQEFLQGNKRRQNLNTIHQPKVDVAETDISPPEPEPDLKQIELAPVGRRGAAAALHRLEEIEERAHARLMRAIESGNQFQVKACQEFYSRASESLRRLDLAVETERRNAQEQVPLRQTEDIALQTSTWLRTAFEQFLSSERPDLMGIKDLGEFKFFAIERFRGILHIVVKSSIKTDSLIPSWAELQVIEGWNVPTL